MLKNIDTGFAAGTLVHTKEGLKPIEDIQVGDLVLTWPEDLPIPKRDRAPYRETGEYIYEPVTEIFSHPDRVISHVVVPGHGNPGDDEMLRVTRNKPIWSKRGGWVGAEILKFGHTLVRANFSKTLVRRATHDVESVTAYNLSVEKCSTYFVGEKGVWVHATGSDR